jgi:hypothetical protein
VFVLCACLFVSLSFCFFLSCLSEALVVQQRNSSARRVIRIS